MDASIVTANISKTELQNIVDNLSLKDVYPLSKTVLIQKEQLSFMMSKNKKVSINSLFFKPVDSYQQ
jgi:hypothetical protein